MRGGALSILVMYFIILLSVTLATFFSEDYVLVPVLIVGWTLLILPIIIRKIKSRKK